MRTHIGVDLDGVTAHTFLQFFAYSRAAYGERVYYRDANTYEFHELFGITPDEHQERFAAFYRSPFFSRITPVPGSQAGMAALAQDSKITVITARAEMITDQTHAWINKYFSGLVSDIHVIGGDHRYARAIESHACQRARHRSIH
jgi:uncharacterized HAD superfamily protein